MIVKKIFINQIKAFLGPPRQNYKILFLNVLGLQILRYFLAYIKFGVYKAKNFNSAQAVNLNKYGYTIINDFLTKTEFERIINTCEKIEKENKFNVKKYGQKKVYSYDFFYNHHNSDPEIDSIKNIFIKRLNESSFMEDISKILKINHAKIPNLSFEKIIAEDGFTDHGDTDSEFHADRFYPCVKIFFYLNDNKIENGAFEYISKSHRFSYDRMYHEYLHSIFICGQKIFSNFMKIFGYEVKNNRVTFKQEKIDKIFGKNSIIACEAPKNSLVICNNKGFHRRGRLMSNTTRLHLRINLYELQMSKIKNSILKFAKNNFYK